MEIIGVLEQALENPWMLLFLATWGLGYVLKEHVDIDAKKIPLILLPFGCVLGLALIEISVGGAIIGGVMALAQMGAYDVFRNLVVGKK